MQEILHVLGLCHDHGVHPDMIDFVLITGDQTKNNINLVKYFFQTFIKNVKKYIDLFFTIK